MATHTDLLLIHGFAIDLDTWFHPKKNYLAGFEAYADEVVSGRAKVFRWSAEKKADFLSSLNPLYYRAHYQAERVKAQDLATLKDLYRLIEDTQPSTIICHSMGCFLLLQYVIRFNLPACVKKVVFIQADCSADDIKKAKLLSEQATFVNVYRRLDPPLWISSIYHKRLRIGLHKVKSSNVKNIYAPSFQWFNPHTAVLHDVKRKQLISSS